MSIAATFYWFHRGEIIATPNFVYAHLKRMPTTNVYGFWPADPSIGSQDAWFIYQHKAHGGVRIAADAVPDVIRLFHMVST